MKFGVPDVSPDDAPNIFELHSLIDEKFGTQGEAFFLPVFAFVDSRSDNFLN